VYKKLLDEEIGLDDIVDIEPEIHKGLQHLLKYDGNV